MLLSATPERARGVDASPFNVLLLHAAIASDMVRAAPTVPALPWLEPDTTTEHDGFSTLLPIWSEHLFHLSLRLSAQRFLWWRAGRDQPLDRGMATASAALHELDAVMGNATSGAWRVRDRAEQCTLSTIKSVTEQELTWSDLYLVSGVSISCPSAARANVWRLTFRCEIAERDVDNVDCAYRTGTRTWHVGGGLSVQPVPNGTMLKLDGGVTTGFWFLSH